jgi:membrane protein implicated in regulation of membrane protease activity
MTEGIFDNMVWWHWWVIAVAFVILEVLSPTVFFMWMAVAALVVGVLLMLVPMSWEVQFLLFAFLSVVAIMGGRTWFRRHPIKTDQPMLNERGQTLVGQVAVVENPIVNGTGRIHIGDSTWKVRGPDAPAGTRVRIVSAESTVLTVELLDH